MKTSGSKVMDEINITPLTDIFLVLLIIMMVVAPILQYGGLPLTYISSDGTAAESSDAKVLTVIVDAQGRYLIGDGEVLPGSLETRMRESAAEFPDGIVIEVNADASLDAMTHALDAARSAGIEKVSLAEGEAPEPK